jgi:hypothetical protein
MGTEASRAESESIIKDALRRDLSLFESKERLTSLEIQELERKYDMISIDFLEKFESGVLGDDQDFFVWWGLIRGLEAIRSRKNKIKRMLLP